MYHNVFFLIPQLLNFLSTPSGKAFAQNLLERKWDTIIRQSKADLDFERGLLMTAADDQAVHKSEVETK
jgi:hypothetical protein